MLDTATIDDFANKLRGRLLDPGDANYDEARSIWNSMIDKRPALIARCTGVADVIEAVDFARRNEMAVAVRGGGHNVAGSSICDGGLMIDLSPMNAVHVDARAATVRVQGGATLGDLDHETQAFGLAVPGGVVSTTGVGGLTLGGGIGWLARKFGLSIDNLLSAEVVTAGGKLLRASAEENPDLFWGLRGGGGNFGVVTSFEFKAHEVGPEVIFGPTLYRLEDAADVLANYREFAKTAPRECCVWADLNTAPPLPFLPERYHGAKVLSVLQFHLGDLQAGEAALAPLREFGEPIADAVGPFRYTAAQRILDEVYAKGLRNYWKAHNFEDLSTETIETLVRYAEKFPSPQSDTLICQLGGAIDDVAPDATAYPHRGAAFAVTPGARWTDAAQDDAAIAWVRDIYESLTDQASGGAYVNFITENEGQEREAYGANYEKLVALKNEYDPANLFRFNQNVRPSA